MKPEPDYKAMWEELKATTLAYNRNHGTRYTLEGQELDYIERKHMPQPKQPRLLVQVLTDGGLRTHQVPTDGTPSHWDIDGIIYTIRVTDHPAP